VGALFQSTKVSKETGEMDAPIQLAIPINSNAVTSDSEDSEKPKSEAVCCSY